MRTKILESDSLYIARVGVIIECQLNGLFQDAHDVILTSWMAARELDDDDGDDNRPLVVYILQRNVDISLKSQHF